MKRNMKKNETDEWLTPESAVIPLVEQLKNKGFKTIWCPFDLDDSNYVKVLKENKFIKDEYLDWTTLSDHFPYMINVDIK